MERFFGFDLGDAESALCVTTPEKDAPVVPCPVRGENSFITAYAILPSGEVLLGEGACYATEVRKRGLRFKSRFLMGESDEAVRTFAKAVLSYVKDEGVYSSEEDSCFYVGCPAGWSPQEREKYRALFAQAGYPPVRVVSESRAALVSAFVSRHLQVGYDILRRPVLVVDVGSSTTDFAYVVGGKEHSLSTGGEVALGGGLLDEALLERALDESPHGERIREIFHDAPSWRSYCEFAARRLKERYYSDEEYWKGEDCISHVRLVYGGRLSLALEMNEEISHALLEEGLASLGGKSFKETFCESLERLKERMEQSPELLFLTGGMAKLPALSTWCQEAFPEAVLIKSQEPELSVAKGLAYCGRIDEDLRRFTREVEDLRDSTVVERIVEKRVGELYRDAVETLTRPILEKAAMPVVERWRRGSIKTLAEIDGELEKAVEDFLKTQEARELLVAPVKRWLRPVAYELEEYTVPICVRHNVPYKSLSLNSYLALSDIDIHVDTKEVFGVQEMTWMIDTIITLVMGLLCGGSGIALIANGLPGIVAGAVISFMVLFLGKDKMQKALLTAHIPLPLRKLLPASYFENRMEKLTDQVKEDFYKSLGTEKNEEIQERLAGDISSQIDECLIRMAKVVEIPLGR
ncbi:MAG: Hsp70 family protein [Blautia sp.]|nr:Hsp70 family protein [Blautia sp.]